jgi:hypothetical protein
MHAANHSNARLLEVLESAWGVLQHHHPELPAAVLMVGASEARGGYRTLGHFARNRWMEQAGEQAATADEVMITGERLNDGAEGVLETLLHEGAHALAHARFWLAKATAKRLGV